MSSLSLVATKDAWRALERVLSSIPTEENRGVVRTYLQERRANGIRMGTLGIDANALRGFCLFLGEKPLKDVTRADVVAYVNEARSLRNWRSVRNDGEDTLTHREVSLSPSTLNKRKEALKPFFRWLRGTDEYPPEVKNLKSRNGNGDAIPTDALLTPEEMKALLQAHPSPRDKALLAVLAESGLRASELCSLNVGSVTFDAHGAVLTLPKQAPGLKTGARRVRLYDGWQYLQTWFESHPEKANHSAPLFYSLSHRAPGARLTPNALWQFTQRAAKAAKLGKDVHPHLFRHTAATEKARLGWTEGMLRAYFGWSRSSDMPSRYVHLAGLDYEELELERRGLKEKGDRGKPALSPLVCKVCKAQNLPTAMFCSGCRHPVSPQAEAELEKRRADELKEAAARLFAAQFKDQIAAEVRRLAGPGAKAVGGPSG